MSTAENQGCNPRGDAAAAPGGAGPERLASLDALRGFDMAWIVGGGGVVVALAAMDANPLTTFLTNQLTHAPWVGRGGTLPTSWTSGSCRGESRGP